MSADGRRLPPVSRYAADDGSTDPRLASELARLANGSGSVADVVRALAEVRVLVPVLAELEACEVGAAGLRVDKQASTGVVAVRGPDGRTALPVFSSTQEMAAWHRSARPVPAQGPLAAASALQEGWELLVLDPAGQGVVVPRPAVVALAAGQVWRPAVQAGRVRTQVREAAVASLAGLSAAGLRTVELEPGRTAEVTVVLGVRPGLDRAGLDRLLALAGRRLASDAEVTAAVDSVELRVVTAP